MLVSSLEINLYSIGGTQAGRCDIDIMDIGIMDANRKKFLSELSKKMKLKKQEDWYRVTSRDITSAGMSILTLLILIMYKGGSYLLIKFFKGSPSQMITKLMPHLSWDYSKFSQVPQSHWDSKENHTKFIEDLSKKLGIKEMEDWYQVTYKDIKSAGMSILTLLTLTMHKGRWYSTSKSL